MPWNYNDFSDPKFAGILTKVPLLAHIKFDLEKIKDKLVDGPSQVPGAKNVREGVVVNAFVERTAHNVGRLQLKIVSNVFYERDSKDESLV